MNQRVADTIGRLEGFIATVDDALALSPEAAAFVHSLIFASGARRGLEIGTSYGYSGLWMASALSENGGTLVTVDHDPRKTEAARGWFESAGLGACVELRTGLAGDVLASLDGPFDFVLNDADKNNCIHYVELLEDKLEERAVVLTDNTISHVADLDAFVKWIRQRRDFRSVGVSIGSGMELSVKLGSS